MTYHLRNLGLILSGLIAIHPSAAMTESLPRSIDSSATLGLQILVTEFRISFETFKQLSTKEEVQRTIAFRQLQTQAMQMKQYASSCYKADSREYEAMLNRGFANADGATRFMYARLSHDSVFKPRTRKQVTLSGRSEVRDFLNKDKNSLNGLDAGISN